MRQTKIFCDLCKKELTDTGYSIDLSLDRMGYTTSIDCSYKDVCTSCGEKIKTFINGLEE